MIQKRILIIDDDNDFTEATKVVLENHGYITDSSQNSSEAMEQILKVKPDLIILDVMMDTADEGFILSRELKKNLKYKNIPILMLTSVQEKTGIDFEPAAGDEEWLPVEGYLSKPVKPDILIEKVRILLC